MKKLITTFLFIVITLSSFSQLSGIYSVGTGIDDGNPATGFATLTGTNGAFTYLEANGLSGNTIFQIDADIAEPMNNRTVTGGIAVLNGHTFRIEADGTTLRTISHTNGNQIRFNDFDNFEIDGNDPVSGTGQYLRWETSHVTGGILRFENDCDGVTIENCYFASDNTSSNEGQIYIGQEGTSGQDNFTIQNNFFQQLTAAADLLRTCVYVREPINAGVEHNNFVFSNNICENIPGFVVFVDNIGANLGDVPAITVSNNSFYNSAAVVRNTSSSYIEIERGSGHTFSSNYFGTDAPYCAGSNDMLIDLLNSSLQIFDVSSAASGTSANNFQGNVFLGIDIDISTTSGYDVYAYRDLSTAPVNIGTTVGNVFGDTTVDASINPSITITQENAASTDVFWIHIDNSTDVDIQNNLMGGFLLDNTTGTTSGAFYGYEIDNAVTGIVTFRGNSIGSYLQPKNMNKQTPGGFYGLHCASSGTTTTNGNAIRGISCDTDFSGTCRMLSVLNSSNYTAEGNYLGRRDVVANTNPSINVAYGSTSNTTVYGIHNDDVDIASITNNYIGGFKTTSFDAATMGRIEAINIDGVATGACTIEDNFIGKIGVLNFYQGTDAVLRGVDMDGDCASSSVSNNVISGLQTGDFFSNSFHIIRMSTTTGSIRCEDNVLGSNSVDATTSPEFDVNFAAFNATADVKGINLTPSGTATTVDVNNNSIGGMIIAQPPSVGDTVAYSLIHISGSHSGASNMNFNNIGSSSENRNIVHLASGLFRLMHNTAASGAKNILNNDIRGVYRGGFAGHTSTYIFYVYDDCTGDVVIDNNNIGSQSVDAVTNPSIEVLDNNTATNQGFQIIRATSRQAATVNDLYITNNTIGGIKGGATSAAAGGNMRGIYSSGEFNNTYITDNQIGSPTQYRSFYQGGAGDIWAIDASGENNQFIQRNNIQGLFEDAFATGDFEGIRYRNSGATVNVNISNNIIGEDGLDMTTDNPSITIYNSDGTSTLSSYGIFVENEQAGSVISVENNVISGIESSSVAAAQGAIYGIYFNGNNFTGNCNNNVIGSATTTNAIRNEGHQDFYGVRNAGADAFTASGNIIQNFSSDINFNDNCMGFYLSEGGSVNTVSNNLISDISLRGTTFTSSRFWGIYTPTTTNVVCHITGNTIQNASVVTDESLAALGVYLTSASAIGNTISGNTITNLEQSGTGSTLNTTVYGIRSSGTSSTGNIIERNSISDLRNLSTHTDDEIWGIYFAGTNNSATVRNNIIQLGENNTTESEITGIYANGPSTASYNIYHNTVLINGNSPGVVEYCYAFERGNSGPTVDVRNNIFQNVRTEGGSTSTTRKFAFRDDRGNTTGVTDYDHNYLWTGVADICRWNNTARTLAEWQTSTGFAANSISSSEILLDAYLIPTTSTEWNKVENFGDATVGVIDDYLTIPRVAAPDMGAYERINIWTAGAGTTDWFTNGNWSEGAPPTCGLSCLIPTVPTGTAGVFPDIDASANAFWVVVQIGATVNMSNDADWTICGSIFNDGSITSASSNEITNLTGTIETIYGTGTTQFNNLDVSATSDYQLVSGMNLELTGYFDNDNGGSFSTAGSTQIQFTGGNAQQILNSTGQTFFDVLVNKTAGTTLSLPIGNNLSITSALTITEGIVDANTNTLDGAGTLSMDSGDLQLAKTGVTVPELLGAFTLTGGTVTLDGTTAAQTLKGSETYNNVTLNNTFATTPQVSISNSLDVNGTLTLSNGTTDGIVLLGAYDIDLGTGSTVSASANNWIDATSGNGGALVKKWSGTGAYTYEVGDADEYSPFTLTFNSGTFGANAEVEMKVTDAQHPQQSSATSYITRYWTVEEADITGFSYDVGYTYQDADIVGTESLINLQKYDAPSWAQYGATNAGTNTLSTTALTSFSDFTGGNILPLPIELLSFTADLNDRDEVDLEWITATETDNDYYVVERSEDGLSWEPILSQPGAGTSTQMLTYTDLDINPLEGVSYYRLKQVDIDDTYAYSNIVVINRNPNKGNTTGEFTMYPNPIKGNNLTIEFNDYSDEDLVINVIDAAGKLVLTKYINGASRNGVVLLDLVNLSKGLYYVRMSTKKQVETKKILLN